MVDGNSYQQAIGVALNDAKSMLGKNEVPNRSEIMQYLHDGGQDLDPHKVAWCAAFVSASLQKAGLPVPTQVVKDSAFGPGAYAPNYQSYGSAVDPKNIQAGDIVVANNGSHVGFAEGPVRQGPNGPEVQLLAGNERDPSGKYTPGSYTSPTGAVANRAQVGMVGERWVPLSQYSARRYQPADSQDAAAAPVGTTVNNTTAAPPASGVSLSPTDRDYIIRTISGEADHPAGDAAVASVIRNRMQSGQWGNTGQAVVQYPGQFSAWNKTTGYGGGAGGNSLVNISSDSPSYQRIGGIVDDVFSGKTPDPTGGALNFYAPGGMKGGAPPSWWSQVKNPIQIGAQWYGTAANENASVTGRPTPGPGRAPIGATPEQPGPIDPSIIARGGTSPPIPTSTPTPGTTINSSPLAGGPTRQQQMQKLNQDLAAMGGQDNKTPEAPQMPPAPTLRNTSPLGGAMLPMSAQLQQGFTGYTPPMPYQGLPPQMQGQGANYGTSLNSLQQLQMMLAQQGMDYG